MKVLSVFGTRPEAIKMAPLVKAMEATGWIKAEVCVTAQHRELLDQVLQFFDITPDYDLDIMKESQSLLGISSEILRHIEPVLFASKPDMILVHGDTTTTLATALAAFYKKIDLGHIEAGLRTGDLASPWPEEGNRRLTGMLAKLHFAPTEESRTRLLAERVPSECIHVTGNTVIDALMIVKNRLESDNVFHRSLDARFGYLRAGARLVLVTGHRRESFGAGFDNICAAIRMLSAKYPDVDFVYPVHPNPEASRPVRRALDGLANVHLIDPQPYLPFVYLMMRSHVILTDSGGIQEEAPALGKPVLVTRHSTERREGLQAGTARLVGLDRESVMAELSLLLDNEVVYRAMTQAHNPYGDGMACDRILEAMKNYFYSNTVDNGKKRTGGSKQKRKDYIGRGAAVPPPKTVPVFETPQLPADVEGSLAKELIF